MKAAVLSYLPTLWVVRLRMRNWELTHWVCGLSLSNTNFTDWPVCPARTPSPCVLRIKDWLLHSRSRVREEDRDYRTRLCSHDQTVSSIASPLSVVPGVPHFRNPPLYPLKKINLWYFAGVEESVLFLHSLEVPLRCYILTWCHNYVLRNAI